MAANSASRSCLAAAFPLFTGFMFKSLGNQWSLTLCAFLLLAIVPFPFLFFKYGHRCQSLFMHPGPESVTLRILSVPLILQIAKGRNSLFRRTDHDSHFSRYTRIISYRALYRGGVVLYNHDRTRTWAYFSTKDL